MYKVKHNHLINNGLNDKTTCSGFIKNLLNCMKQRHYPHNCVKFNFHHGVPQLLLGIQAEH